MAWSLAVKMVNWMIFSRCIVYEQMKLGHDFLHGMHHSPLKMQSEKRWPGSARMHIYTSRKEFLADTKGKYHYAIELCTHWYRYSA